MMNDSDVRDGLAEAKARFAAEYDLHSRRSGSFAVMALALGVAGLTAAGFAVAGKLTLVNVGMAVGAAVFSYSAYQNAVQETEAANQAKTRLERAEESQRHNAETLGQRLTGKDIATTKSWARAVWESRRNDETLNR
ncbi:hypothetical protein [Rhodopirellula baltica]